MASLHNSNYPKPNFNESQIKVIEALCNACFRSHANGEADAILARLPQDREEWQTEAATKIMGMSFTDFPNATDELIGLMGRALSPTVIAELSLALTMLSTTAGTWALAYGWARPFYDIPLLDREQILQRWLTSRVDTRRKIVRAFAVLALYVVYAYYDTAADATGYPSPSRRPLYKPLQAPSFVYTFLQPEAEIIQTEVLIIGSGAGGGVVASVISRGGDVDALATTDKGLPADGGSHNDDKQPTKQGLQCLVVEKGIYAPTGEKSRSQKEGFQELYQSGGVMCSESGSISVLAGSVFGGGTTINWSGSLRTQHFVREAWARQYGLTHFLSDDFARSLDAVCEKMGVSSKHIKQNEANARLIKGSEKLGYHVDAIPQNTSGNQHACGFCTLGCPYGEKQGSVETFMKDAAATGRTEFLQQTEVTRLLFASEDDANPTVTSSNIESYTYSPLRTKCIGAELIIGDGTKRIALASKAVVVSGGSINSPAILLRSGLKNPNIGKNLHLHPVSFVSGYFKEKINPWDGAIMTAVSNVCENREGSHFGAKLEVCSAFPGGQASLNQRWESSADHKGGMLEHNHKFTMISLTRDRDGGSIVIDAQGRPRINYDISPFDAASCLKGVLAACEVMLAAGAKRIATTQAGVPKYTVPDDHKGLIDPRWIKWTKQVEEAGVHCGWTGMASAHQMGSCSMGTTPKSSVIDPRGRVWGTTSLYVADASTFPTASGVNPMVTTMAVSHSIATFILQDLQG